MSMTQMLIDEMDQEAKTTRNMLSRVPDDQYDWKPHPRSMTIRSLATHIAELPSWVKIALTTDELDFESNPYQPVLINNTRELLEVFDKSLTEGRSQLEKAREQDLEKDWTLRMGKTILAKYTKGGTIRMAYSQTVHHRAQLGVFLRLLDIPIPGSYGPSADETEF
jgi:uncharacterized damage-inducible protein DinB